jgi:hypothetical protein
LSYLSAADPAQEVPCGARLSLNLTVAIVRNAALSLVAAQHVDPSREELVAHAKSAQTLGAVVDRRLEEGLGHVAAMRASLADIEREVGAAPAQASVKRAVEASHQTLAPMSAWSAGFRSEVVPHVADAALLASKVVPRRVVLVIEGRRLRREAHHQGARRRFHGAGRGA